MKTQFQKAAATLLAAALHAGISAGAGFSLYETSARGVAMGGATMGRYHDASAVYANPALLPDADGDELLFGLSFINPGMKIKLATQEGSKKYAPQDQWFPPPFAYCTHKFGDGFALGCGLYSPYGLGIQYSPDWPGRFSSVETEISTFNLNPNLAWKVGDRLSVAVGLDVLYFDILLARNVPVVDRLLRVEGDSIGFGANAAIACRLTDNLGFGLVYRSKIREEVEGRCYVDGIPGDYGAWENLTLPQSVSAGLNYSGLDRWDFGVVATWTDWSSYDSLTLHFDRPLLGKVREAGAEKNWGAVWRLGAGAEYRLSDYANLAFGYVYDQDPIDLDHADYLLPAGSRNIFSLGLNTKLSETWRMGLTYARIILADERLRARPAEGLPETRFLNGRSNVVSIDFSTAF